MKINFLFFFFFLTILTACSNFQQVQLEQTEAVNPKLSFGTMPVANPNLLNGDGTIDSFSEQDHRWESEAESISLSVLDGNLIIKTDSVEDADYISKKFNPLDFTKSIFLKITFRQPPVNDEIKLSLLDVYQNGAIITGFVKDSDLYFNLDPQTMPANFNIGYVTEMRISGFPSKEKIFIDRISVTK